MKWKDEFVSEMKAYGQFVIYIRPMYKIVNCKIPDLYGNILKLDIS